MKSKCLLFLSFSIFLTLKGRAQVSSNLRPAFFIDSMRVDFEKTYIEPDNIKDINVVKGYDSVFQADGKVYITLKSPKPILLTLTDVIAKKTSLKSPSRILFIIDGKVQTDTAGVRIESSIVRTVQVTNETDINYLRGNVRPMSILSIETSLPKPPAPDSAIIRIR
jgi:hypothetical protein